VISAEGTIVAAATAPAAASRGVVRISGPAAIAAVCGRSDLAGGPGVARCRVRTSLGEVPAIALVGRGPSTFTGEDTVELATTGHPAMLEAIVQALVSHPGVRRAGPGEFTARAFLAGKLDLLEAESIAIAISSAGDAELAAARSLAGAGLGVSARSGADRLADVLAGIEAGIDFTDEEDVVPVPPDRLASILDEVERMVRDQLAPRAARSAGRGRVPLVALAGPANAGKSSLFNALLGRERAVTAPVRGTTRDAIVETLDLEHAGRAVRVAIADLAGEEIDGGELEPATRRRREQTIAEADLVLRCVPPGTPVPPGDERTIVVATKSDLAPAPDRAIATSVRTGAGIDRLRSLVAERAAAISPRESTVDEVAARHVEALERALDGLRGARALVPRVRSQPELVAAAIAGAIAPLRELTGVGTPDEVLGRIFARFCIGK